MWILLAHKQRKGRHYCQTVKRIVCPVPGDCTGLLFLSELQSPIHFTHTCPCFHQGNKVREKNTGYDLTYLLFVYPLGPSVPSTDGKQQAAVAL